MIIDIADVVKEKNIVVFSPHYDDFPLMMAGFILELKKEGLLQTKKFTNVNVFSRSNYQLRDIEGNQDTSLSRIKYAVGNRILEDMSCMDELFGLGNYSYRLLCEFDCQIRGKKVADSEMEFHHGTYEDLDDNDHAIIDRVRAAALEYMDLEDTALFFPAGFKEHIDHFIVREAGIKAMKSSGRTKVYFAEEKPLSGISSKEEEQRIYDMMQQMKYEQIAFKCDPQAVTDLVFKHYVSQVEEVYRKGIFQRAKKLKSDHMSDHYLDSFYTEK